MSGGAGDGFEIHPPSMHEGAGHLAKFGQALQKGGTSLENSGQNLLNHVSQDSSGIGATIEKFAGHGLKTGGKLFTTAGGWAERASGHLHGSATAHEENEHNTTQTFRGIHPDDKTPHVHGGGPNEPTTHTTPGTGNTKPVSGPPEAGKVNSSVDRTLRRVNPKYKAGETAYSENCTGVVQAYEMTRRGVPSEAGPLEKHLRSDEGGPGGRTLSAITGPWGGRFTPGTKADIEDAFKEPGSRGVVYVEWNHPSGLPIANGAHVFNVENVGGQVRFLDGQPTPPVTDASHYFDNGHDTMYIRLDDRPTPPSGKTKPYLEP